MSVLGVDLGTSGVKLLLAEDSGYRQQDVPYRAPGFEACYQAFLEGVRGLAQTTDLKAVGAIGLSGQTGSYAVLRADGSLGRQIGWQQAGRQQHLDRLLQAIAPDVFLQETGMLQPRIASYPLPTITYLGEDLAQGCRLLQPKDYLCLRLSGEALTDPYSWRGLAHPGRGGYSRLLLKEVGLEAGALPEIAELTALSRQCSEESGLRAGIPVHVGLNDFYASLVALDVKAPGDAFDVAGTSEHVGGIVEGPRPARLIRSPYPGGRYVHYGVTASSGVSLRWGEELLGPGEPKAPGRAPLFLPYLKGERAPVFDEEARGMMIGLTDRSDRDALRYSVWEGVVFSLFSVFQALRLPRPALIRATGGPTRSPVLNTMKASMFGAPLLTGELSGGSAAGAAVLAGARRPELTVLTRPDPALADTMARRFEVWRKMYGAWRDIVAGNDVNDLF